MKIKKIFLIMKIIFGLNTLFGQNTLDIAHDHWLNGNIKKAHDELLRVMEILPNNQEAKHLLMKSFFVQGKYIESLQTFKSIDKNYHAYPECVELAIQANIHLKDLECAVLLAQKNRYKQLSYLQEFKERPLKLIAEETYYIPFLQDDEIPADFWPGLMGRINGIESKIRFDTGGDYIIAGVSAAKKLGIDLKHKTKSMHAATKVTVWHSIIDSMTFDNGPAFLNVPVTVINSLGDFIIFGTNILEMFLTTIDYQNMQFIFTPRNDKELLEQHYNAIPGAAESVDFYLWDDHYMFAKGNFAGNDSLNLFFDSGLIAVTEINGSPEQASFTASKQSLMQWGIDKSRLKQNTFFPTAHSLSIGNRSQPNTLVWFDKNLIKDRNFGGVRIDGLISHAWLKNYAWTIDFDKMEYLFNY